ncbi:MAG: type II toxin-antitoxin system HicB family antitoxin [Verrucomicrobia bacterium]|nr:type II toxin-antitoxin system HicB family antitoxin [Verrucomicrobiota bacterium]
MLTEYLLAALSLAHYELTKNGRFFGSIPPCPGVWAEAATLEGCREELRTALEGWVLLGLQRGDALPVIAGLDLNPKVAAHAEAE